MKSSIKQTYKNASPYQCMTHLTYVAAPQHLWHHCMIILMHVHGIKARNKENTLI